MLPTTLCEINLYNYIPGLKLRSVEQIASLPRQPGRLQHGSSWSRCVSAGLNSYKTRFYLCMLFWNYSTHTQHWCCYFMLASQRETWSSFQSIFLKNRFASFILHQQQPFQHLPATHQDAIWQSLIKMLIHFNKRQVINCNYVSSERWRRAGVWGKLAGKWVVSLIKKQPHLPPPQTRILNLSYHKRHAKVWLYPWFCVVVVVVFLR